MKKLQKMLLSMFLCLSIVFTIPLVLPETAAIRTVHAATQIRLNKTQATLISGQTTTLKVSGTTQKVTWTSSNKVIATVSANGVVSAKKKGTAIITAKVGSKKYTCKITVETPVISKTAVSIIAGDRYTLKVTGTTQKVIWTSGNTSIATVSKNGLVIGKKKGVTVITAKVGTKKYTCKVTVESPTISKTAVTITEGNKITLKLNGTTQKVTWTSGNTSIATVSTQGVVTAKRKGTAIITAKVGTKKYTCKVTVKAKTIPIQSVSLDKSSLLLEAGERAVIQVTVAPANTTENKTVTWTSSNTKVATVSHGIVTATGAGTATITAKAGSKKATCYVQVMESYGTVSGNITWHYNQYRGYVPDTGARVFLFPTDKSAAKYTTSDYTDFLYPENRANQFRDKKIYCAVADGNGNYTISNIPVGEYYVVIISKNCKSEGWFEADNKDDFYALVASGMSEGYLNKATINALARSVQWNEYDRQITNVFKNQTTTVNNAFPYTYW